MRQERPIEHYAKDKSLTPLAQTLAAAFHDEPGLSWIMPKDAKRHAMLPKFFQVMAEQSRRHGEILASPDGAAASLCVRLRHPPRNHA